MSLRDPGCEQPGPPAFSFIPVVGVYSDIRDASGELLKLWPGGEDFNWVAFTIAAAGIATEFTPADLALDVLKALAKRVQPGGPLLKAVLGQIKDNGVRLAAEARSGGQFVLQEFNDTIDYMAGLLGPPFGPPPVQFAGGYGDYLRFLDRKLVDDPVDWRISQALAERFEGFEGTLAGIVARYGDDAGKRDFDVLGELDDAAKQLLADAGKLDIVVEEIGKAGWDVLATNQYYEMVKKLGADSQRITQFDEISDIEGSGRFIYELDAPDTGPDQVFAVIQNKGKDNVTNISVKLREKATGSKIVGDIDIRTLTEAIKVKANINNKNNVYIYDQLKKLAIYAKINGKPPVLAVPESVGELKRLFCKVCG